MPEMNYLHISKELQQRLIASAERNRIRSGRAPWAVRARMILEKALDDEERNGKPLTEAALFNYQDIDLKKEKKKK